jgi:hypothetical protein
MRFSREFLVCLPHVRVISDLCNPNASFGVGVKDFSDEVLALR